MTYEELKNRLSKCELSLEKIKNGTVNLSNTKDFAGKKKKLQILKESLTKQIKEAEETMFVGTKGGDTKAVKISAKTALDLKSDPNITSIDTAKGKTIKERLKDNKGVVFSIDETKSIAKAVGEAVAISLKSLGDEVSHMKAKHIEENSFEIYVEYKNNSSDEFSFYITDDSLHLVDFSFDKELTDVGVKPSGEAVVNVDVLANELTKHFKSMNEISEAPNNKYYIKIPKDAASQNKAQVIFNDIYDIDYEINDDPNGIVMYFEKEKFNPGLLDDLEGDMVQILDTNIPNINEDAEEDAKNDADYEAGWHDDPRKDEDVDVGHQDDEPDMLQSTAYETAQYAAKLVKKLQKYDQFDGEVDFPNWWQSKLILAKDYMQKAYHYLDSEEKQPAIDQLALENVDKVAGGIPYKREGNKFIITEPLDDATKERIISKAKEHGHHAAPNQAGGVTIMAKENVNERLSGDARQAIYDLQDILDRAAQLGDEARQIVKDNFPNELSAGEAYDVFSFGTSSNSYDKTLETLISDIERTAEEEDMDMDEGRKDKDALYPDNPRLPEIKNLADKIISMVKAEAAKGELGYIRTMEEIRYQQEDDFERTPEWNKAKGIRADFDDYGSGTNEGVAKTKKEYDTLVGKMKQLAQHFKTAEGDKKEKIKDALLTHTKRKRALEQELDDAVSGIGRGQELAENEIEDAGNEIDKGHEAYQDIRALIQKHARRLNDDDAYTMHELLKDFFNRLLEATKDLEEAGPGFAHDCAAKVVHETYGKGTCIPEKHTLVREGKKYVVTHYDVLFESGKTIEDIPVSELDVKTSNEHWHKGYKKKKK